MANVSPDKAIAYYTKKRDEVKARKDVLMAAFPKRGLCREDAIAYTMKIAIAQGKEMAFDEVIAMMIDLKRLDEEEKHAGRRTF